MGKDNPLTNKQLRQYLADLLPSATILDNPSFDNSIIGTTDTAIVYDIDKMIKEMMDDDGIGYGEALEFIEYNTLRALPYMGDNKPIIIYPLEE